MKYTNNYNLKKPEGNDAVDIEDFNSNAEIIDFELAKRALKGELTEGLNLKIDNTKKSDSVTLDSSDSVATSKAVKVAYDKGVEALGKAGRNETQLTEMSTHTTDNIKHIAASERTAWNAKQSALGFTPLNKAGDTATGMLKAQSNTSYTVAQLHNVILSTSDAVLESMQNGDIWIKYA